MTPQVKLSYLLSNCVTISKAPRKGVNTGFRKALLPPKYSGRILGEHRVVEPFLLMFLFPNRVKTGGAKALPTRGPPKQQRVM